MSSRADKAAKSQKDKHHTILRELVQEPANKTCAECLAKGPRWSSWSLGVFVCIRCAGIHRNLGVHISKMKSIDLDSWTPEQLQNVLRWGNKRAAEYYECYLPKDFSRPQANHALEAFIRNKYEKKLYIKKDGEPPENSPSKVDRLKNDSKEEKEKEKKTTTTTSRQRREKKVELTKPAVNNSNNTILNMAKTEPAKAAPTTSNLLAAEQHQKSHSMNDLLSLDHPTPAAPTEVKHSASSNDLLNFGGWSDPVPAATPAPSDPFSSNAAATPQSNTDLFANAPVQSTSETSATSSAPAKSSKESILSLYGSSTNTGMQAQQQQQQMFGVPGGVYTMNNMMGQPQQQSMQQHNRFPQQQQQMQQGYNQQGMMNQMNQMNMQMQQMNFNQQQPQQFNMMNQQQQNFNAYKQQPQPQQQQMLYNNTQQQQQRQQPMMNTRMNSGAFSQQPMQQQNFNMMGQQGMGQPMGGGMQQMGWGQQQQSMGQPQSQMFGGMNGMNGTANSNTAGGGGNTMNNLLWN